jgi:ribosomal protein L37E
MSCIKNYFLALLQQCSEERFGQDAVEWAIVNGQIPIVCNLTTDLHTIFDQHSNCCDAPPKGELDRNHHGRCRQCGEGAVFESIYDCAVVAYQQHCREHDASHPIESGLAEEILRPVSLAESV